MSDLCCSLGLLAGSELPRIPVLRTWMDSTTKRVHVLHTSGHFVPTKPEYDSTLAPTVAIIEAYAKRPCHESRTVHEGDKTAPLLGGVPGPALRGGDGYPLAGSRLRTPRRGRRDGRRSPRACREDALGGRRTVAGLRGLPEFGARVHPLGDGRRRGGGRDGVGAPLDARSAPEGAGELVGVQRGLRGPGSPRACQPRGGPEAGAHAGQPTPAFAQLQEGGCIEVKGRRVYVRDFDALRRSAGE